MNFTITFTDQDSPQNLRRVAAFMIDLAGNVPQATEGSAEKPTRKPRGKQAEPEPTVSAEPETATAGEPAPPADEPAKTLPEVRALLAEKSRAGKREEVQALIKSYGATSLPEIPSDKLNEVFAKGEAL